MATEKVIVQVMGVLAAAFRSLVTVEKGRHLAPAGKDSRETLQATGRRATDFFSDGEHYNAPLRRSEPVPRPSTM